VSVEDPRAMHGTGAHGAGMCMQLVELCVLWTAGQVASLAKETSLAL
jgi:hypothetical protein